MIEIDGSQASGSGTIVRYAVALSALTAQPLHLKNARAKRGKPGLRAQHLTSVQACAALCDATTDGLAVGSSAFVFTPGDRLHGGRYAWDIGTAGSTTMLAMSLLPLAAFAAAPLTARISGGVFQDFAPSPHHLKHALATALERMGLRFDLEVVRAGYVPHGAGVVELTVQPVRDHLGAIILTERGEVTAVHGVAFSSHLAERRVSDRMAQACGRRLAEAGLACTIERRYDTEASHPGAGLAIWARTSTGCMLGADLAGAQRRSSEAIGDAVAGALLEDLATGSTVDRHAADMLVIFAALAAGTTVYLAPRVTEHLATNLWLIGQFGARAKLEGGRVEVKGLGLERRG